MVEHSNTDRVAVITVHGIADQQPGQTVRELARLLCHGGEGQSGYVEGETHGVLVPVARLESGTGEGTATASETRVMPGAPSGFYRASRRAAALGDAPDERDLGIRLTDYLLRRHRLAEHDALHESTRISLVRRGDGRTVDIYEMYWADLSRLRAGGVRALSAMYQLFFHLSTLARDIVDQVALTVGASPAWRTLQCLHAWSAWLMTGPAALIQMTMLLLLVFGATALVPSSQHGYLIAALFAAAAVLLGGFAVLAGLREPSAWKRRLKFASLLVAAVACAAVAAAALLGNGPRATFFFGAAVLLVAVIGALLVARYARVARGVRAPGLALVGATCAALLVDAKRWLPHVSTLPEWMLTAALHVGEYLLAALLIVWAALAAVQIGALLLGLGLARAGDTKVKASLYTARLALVFSSTLFAVLSLVLWSVIGYLAGVTLQDFTYEPSVFGSGYRGAAIFLEERVQSVGGFFTPLLLAAGVLATAALLVLAPSLREELAPSVNVDAGGVRREAAQWAPRLGRWLSGGMRRLGRALGLLVPLLAIAGGAIYIAFVVQQFLPGIAGAAWLARTLDLFQGEALVAAGKWIAGGALTITALGARFARTFGRLRVVLDAVLDLDNYFADPLDRGPPRARIFSRYAGLLAYLRARGYARIVIVAHSQGSVISADLLRYLSVQRRLRALLGELPIALVTVGSPLRDLYAARFPLLYRWMGSNAQGFAAAGPVAADIGATIWVNAYRSGDYVGRALWTAAGEDALFAVAAIDPNGQVQAQRAGDRTEFCLGAGAHTHYFSNDAVALAVEIDRLVSGGVKLPPT